MSRAAIGFLLHPREEPGVVASAVAEAERAGYTSWVVAAGSDPLPEDRLGACRLLVTVGGDGTFLLGARIAAARGLPLLGANRGQLGFLTDVDLAQLPAAVAEFAAGRHREDRRSLLELDVPGDELRGQEARTAVALNEVVVKTTGTNLARLRVTADDELLGDYDADGVIIATATGSTAYALSAGGPPVDPRLRAVVFVPLAAHAVLTRPVVLPEAVTFTVTVVRGRAFAAADGSVEVPLRERTRLTVSPGPELSVVRVRGSTTFVHRLRDKMRMGVPLKQMPHRGDDTEID
ncbi:MAG TPA: NAD(+)/NADH kinase [Candidatus Dormibacteraeota bacterium]|nr:NAD(+)/NADH kinase [Candidatus Dormibacteraeota bacterium]